MEFLSRYKTQAIVLLAVLVAAVVWYGLSGTTPPTTLLTTQSVSDQSGVADRGVVETLLTLRTVSLSGTIFSDPAFMGLKDFGTQIIPEPVGRENPFAPLPPSVRPTSTPRTTQLFPTQRP